MSKRISHNRGKGANLQWLRDRATYDGDDCLIWPFSKTWNGYGHVSINGRLIKAHRVMCELAHGAQPSPKYVAAHSCNNGHGGCVNPRHLVWKTPRENLLDRRAAGTLPTKRWNNKGTVSVQDMEFMQALKPFANQRELGALFGVSYQHVSVIQQGKLKRQRKSA